MKLNRYHAVAVSAALAAIGTFAAVGLSSTGSGVVQANPVAKASYNQTVHLNNDSIKFQTKEPTDVRVQTLTFSPAGRTGWHHHPGFVIVAVQSGEVTVFDAACNPTSYGPSSPNGGVFVESGDNPIEVRNLTTSTATVYATFVAPRVDPAVFRIEDAPPACA